MKIYTLQNKNIEFKECVKCVMNNHVTSLISFDEQGVCSYCHTFDKIKARTFGRDKSILDKELADTIEKIKAEGKGKKYDCVVGLSGGVDSTYLAYLAKEYGLRPLAVHFDNGWNSELSVKNIENIIQKTGFDLYTYVVNWEEFKDLQKAYLKASVIDIEVLTDQMIFACLYQICRKYNIQYLLSGTNYCTELVLARDWVYNKFDSHNIDAIHKRFGTMKIRSYPKLGYLQLYYYRNIRKLNFVEFLNLIEYKKTKVKDTIQKEFDWKDYGGKHYESSWTKFYQGYILPKKFGVDKRYGHLSNLIMNGEITKEQALEELKQPPLKPEEEKEMLEYVLKKLEYTQDEWDQIMAAKPVPHEFYGTQNDSFAVRAIQRITKFFTNSWVTFKIHVGSPAKKLVRKALPAT